MANEPTSKSIDGITDLVVVAPIREGFIQAYENVTYATRLRIVAEALNRIRIAAREHERILPFSDVTERILTLLDFRVGVIDKDLFALSTRTSDASTAAMAGSEGPESRRYLYLTATFDGAWEPYMRLIWQPLGPFLDLLFCNCEGYVTASEHGFDEYAQWVRDNQMDSAIFYATTGLTVRDHLYLQNLEQVQRAAPAADSDRSIARLTMPQPEAAAAAERRKALTDLAANDPRQYGRIHEQALEILTVLYRLADYYPPEWLTGRPKATPRAGGRRLRLSEGQYLARVARDLLLGWEELIPTAPGPLLDHWQQQVAPPYRDPLHWFDTGNTYLEKLDRRRRRRLPPDPAYDASDVQGGILSAFGSRATPARHGALLLMTITDPAATRSFIAKALSIAFESGPAADADDRFRRTIGFTADGLRRIGLETGVIDRFPKEFRDGMEARSGLIGDMRENHPREWRLPERNWPPNPAGVRRPPVDMSEVDIVIQIRTATGTAADVAAEVDRLARLAAPGLATVSVETMLSDYLPDGAFIDHFGFNDGVSQPRPTPGLTQTTPRQHDQVRLGEVLLGYANDRDDCAPLPFASERGRLRWRAKLRATARRYQVNGTFLVIRKLEQHVETFDGFIAAEVARINRDHPALPRPMTDERLKALMLGRYPDGRSLEPTSSGANDFDYRGDPDGVACPFAAHVRRTNPRDAFQGRPAPRILRRGMSFDQRDPATGAGARGLVFMAYNASIAEQFETIQRWINGGNSTFVASGHADPLLGVAPRTSAQTPQARTFRFVEGDDVIRITMPDPFVSLHWGLYLFVPSRTALAALTKLSGGYRPMEEASEARGQAVLDRLAQLGPVQQGEEWKRLLEDFDAKDPSERNISPDLWAAIRRNKGGSVRIDGGIPFGHDRSSAHPPGQPIVLSASHAHVMRVLTDWKAFTSEEQLRRIEPNSGPIYVTQQPDDAYRNADLRGKYDYRRESEATNVILMGYDEAAGFRAGRDAGRGVLAEARAFALATGRDYYEIELRRQFLLPALGALCHTWYGLPDGIHMQAGPWLWELPAKRNPPGARCPGDFLAPSRNAFYPRPSNTVGFFASEHGAAILAASRAFVQAHRPSGGVDTGSVAAAMFAATPDDDELLARNLIGTMIGAIPPMDGNLRGILLEWLTERTLWRHQAALHRAVAAASAADASAAALAALRGPVSQAMCKRPAPDLLYRTASASMVDGEPLVLRGRVGQDVAVGENDLMVVSLVSASQRSLLNGETPDGDVSIIFGGKRKAAYQPSRTDTAHPVHACPARDMAMGAIIGIMTALLEAGRIQALPASLIVRIGEWP